jgi:GTP pyrophosphokinase
LTIESPAIIDDLGVVLEEWRRHYPQADDGLIRRAHDGAARAHEGQSRKSGEPYITHPLAVAHVLAGYGLDAETIAAALLHDTVEDTEVTLQQVEQDFGGTVAALIDGVTKLDRIAFGSHEEFQAATIRKMVVAMARDVRVLLLKLADRLHNVRTIAPLGEEKQRRIARETLEVYAPLAHRLGVQEIKHEMEDRCFAILHPLRDQEIRELLATRAPKRDAYIAEVVSTVERLLAEHDISATVSGRPKHIYSIYRKLVDSGRSFDEIHDLIGIRVITKSLSDCYAALGIVHTRWPPVHGRFKDYVAMPKFNLYQSIHTTVLGSDGKPLEVQIRTLEMHERAERGIAAHWRYKEGDAPASPEAVREISAGTYDFDSPAEFLAGLKLDLYQDEVFVFTPAGEVKSLPAGATPVDFAYSVHTEVGHRCTGAKVNGRLMPLSTRLESGDIVEIITSKADDPSRDWLKFVRTGRAAAKIRQWFTREHREHSIADGREQVGRLLRKEGLGLGAGERDELLSEVAKGMGHKDRDAMFQSVGDGAVQPATVVGRLRRLIEPEAPEEEFVPTPRVPAAPRSPSRGVVVEGLSDMWVRLARCCSPVPGDQIVGFVTVGRGVSVHRSDCTNMEALEERTERMVEVSWGADQGDRFTTWVQVEALDRAGLLRDVTIALSELGMNIASSSTSTGSDRIAVLRFEVELADASQADRAVSAIHGVEGVFDAYRLTPGGG